MPEGNGKFLIFSVTNATAPVLNNAGQLAFWASLSDHERRDVRRHRHLFV